MNENEKEKVFEVMRQKSEQAENRIAPLDVLKTPEELDFEKRVENEKLKARLILRDRVVRTNSIGNEIFVKAATGLAIGAGVGILLKFLFSRRDRNDGNKQ